MAYNNAESREKQRCRDYILHECVFSPEMRSKNKRLNILTLPSTNFLLENRLLKIGNVNGVYCLERDNSIYEKQQMLFKDGKSDRLQLINSDCFDFLFSTQEKFDVLWLDLCGPLNINL